MGASPEGDLRRNRRRNPRVRLAIPVKFRFADAPFVAAHTTNYSESGVYVFTQTPPPEGSWIVLRLQIADFVVDVEALVVRSVPRVTGGQPPGFAAEFVVLPRRVRHAVLRLLASWGMDGPDATASAG